MNEVVEMSLVVFATQLVFIGCRTWNVKAIAKNSVPHVLMSGAVVHLSWLVSIAIGAVSMNEIIVSADWAQLPVIICSLVGGLLGSYIGMKEKQAKGRVPRMKNPPPPTRFSKNGVKVPEFPNDRVG